MPAKLMKNRPTEVHEEPHHGRAAIVVSVTALVLLTVVGLFLVIGPGGSNSDDASDVTLDTWAASASEECARIADEHSVLSARPDVMADPQRAQDVSAAVVALSAAIDDIPPPTTSDGVGSVTDVVQLGEHAADTWSAIAVGDVADNEVNAAVDLVGTYVTALNDLGAGCSALSP